MTLYQYKPLENDEIRLLVLHAGVANAPITASIRHALLAGEAIVYDALSYCWGHDTPKSWILLDRCKFEVSENLRSAFRHLRQRSTDRVLWVDAICINQQDLNERSKQVLRMGTIYHGAITVRAWLGPAADYSEFAMEHLQNAKSESFKGGLRGGGLSNVSGAIVSLITRPWFRRRWVIQEVAFAREVVLHCGYDTLPWSTFCKAIKAMNMDVRRGREFHVPKISYQDTRNHSSSVYSGDPDAQSATSLIFAAEDVLGEKLKASTSQVARLCNLDILVERFGSFFVSDKHDAIYALLPLAGDTYLSRDWKPDYKLDVLQVYRDFITYSVQRTGSLDILVRPWAPETRSAHLHFQPRPHSWIACYWGPTSVTGDSGGRIRVLIVPLVGMANKKNYAASGSSRVATTNFVGNTLRVHGIQLDTIMEHYNSLVEWDMGQQPVPKSQPRSDRFRSLLHNADQAHQSLETMFSIKTGRCYFLSKTGIMGLAPSISKAGDMVCILFGCSVPVILREEGNECILVGECYADGFMQGEGMKDFERGMYPFEEFLLV